MVWPIVAEIIAEDHVGFLSMLSDQPVNLEMFPPGSLTKLFRCGLLPTSRFAFAGLIVQTLAFDNLRPYLCIKSWIFFL